MQPGENHRLISLRHRSGAKGSRSATWFHRSEHFARPQFMAAIRLLMHQSKPVLDRNSHQVAAECWSASSRTGAVGGSLDFRFLSWIGKRPHAVGEISVSAGDLQGRSSDRVTKFDKCRVSQPPVLSPQDEFNQPFAARTASYGEVNECYQAMNSIISSTRAS